MSEQDARWVIVWDDELQGWAVRRQEFEDSWYDIRYEAEQRRDELNRLAGYYADYET